MATKTIEQPPPPQWVLDLNSTPSTRPKASKIQDPPGFEALTSGKVLRHIFFHPLSLFKTQP